MKDEQRLGHAAFVDVSIGLSSLVWERSGITRGTAREHRAREHYATWPTDAQ